MKSNIWLIALSVACVCLAGCTGPRVYHQEPSVFASAETNFYSAFIEFDEHGEFWDSSQLSNAVRQIETSNPVFLVTYIHGWKNNADFENGNYRGFTNMLDALARELKSDEKAEKRLTVVGIYIGWRGDTLRWKDPVSNAARQLTFWSRRNTAERVAGTSATETLYRILKAANSNTNSKVVLIGHSMGALILEKALSQALVATLLGPRESIRTNPAPANLVLLVNSAAPSLYARQFISMLRRLPSPTSGNDGGGSGQKTFDESHPLIIAATSKGDWATGKIFPIGMRLGALNKSFRRYGTNDDFGGKQLHYYTTTAGHNSAFWSHSIDVTGKADKRRLTGEAKKQAAQRALYQNIRRRPEMSPNTFTNRGQTFRIVPMIETKRKNKTPYWVMRVPTTVIKDHGDIFHDRFNAFVGALLRMNEVTDAETPRRQIDPRQFKAAK